MVLPPSEQHCLGGGVRAVTAFQFVRVIVLMLATCTSLHVCDPLKKICIIQIANCFLPDVTHCLVLYEIFSCILCIRALGTTADPLQNEMMFVSTIITTIIVIIIIIAIEIIVNRVRLSFSDVDGFFDDGVM